MSILKYKYKLHKLVNSLFYVFVFSIGFFTGFLTNKIDFNKVISQFLMIDNVKAYSIVSPENSLFSVDEEFIIEAFSSSFTNFDFNDSPYILCSYYSKFPMDCMAMDKNMFNSLFVYSSNSAGYNISYSKVQNATLHMLRINSDLSYYGTYNAKNTELPGITGGYLISIYSHNVNNVKSFTNFNLNLIDSNMNSINSKVNVLYYRNNSIISTTDPTDSVDEEFIINAFENSFESFNYLDVPYISCSFSTSFPLYCVAMNKNMFNSLYVKSSSSAGYSISYNAVNNATYYQIKINSGLSISILDSKINTNLSALGNDYYFFDINSQTDSHYLKWKTFTNFNPSNIDTTMKSIDTKTNILDFNDYGELKFNSDIFKNDENFKEVCIDKGKKYGITTNNIDSVTNSIFASDFIWFPGKTTGVKYSEYNSLNENKILIFDENISTENYYFKDKDKIDSIFSDEIVSNYFNHSGYTNKYSYYGYTAYKFIHSYYVDENNIPQNMFTIFDFSNINFSIYGSAGGSSSSFGDEPLTYCFYIKNEYNVTELKTNEWNDYVGSVPTPGGNLDITTTHNKNNVSDLTDSYFTIINNFISQIRPTINFINSNIYDLFNSMPLIVKSFIISFLVLILIRGLIRMVIK